MHGERRRLEFTRADPADQIRSDPQRYSVLGVPI